MDDCSQIDDDSHAARILTGCAMIMAAAVEEGERFHQARRLVAQVQRLIDPTMLVRIGCLHCALERGFGQCLCPRRRKRYERTGWLAVQQAVAAGCYPRQSYGRARRALVHKRGMKMSCTCVAERDYEACLGPG